MTHRPRGLRRFVVASLLLVVPAFAVAQESRSAQLAAELVMLLDAGKLDSIAANVEGDEYVGALYFSGSQLLVVKARYSVPERMDVKVADRLFRDVYIDLNSASVPDSKILVSDAGVNGLQARRGNNQPYDTVDMGGKSYAFDGDWDNADLSEQEYTDAFEMSDAEYTRMLEALVAHLREIS